MSIFNSLYNSVKFLLKEQDTMNNEQRKQSQFTLLIVVHSIQYVVGKGGLNTMFYIVNKGERKVCYPEEMLKIIKSWDKAEQTAFFVYDGVARSIVSGPYASVEEAQQCEAKKEYKIVGNGKSKAVLYKSAINLNKQRVWKKYDKIRNS